MGVVALLVAQDPTDEIAVVPLGVGLVFAAVVALWVYVDARTIGARKGLVHGIANNSAGVWALGAFLLMIVVVPLYLFHRDRIRVAAGRNGPYPRRRGGIRGWQDAVARQPPIPTIPPIRFEPISIDAAEVPPGAAATPITPATPIVPAPAASASIETAPPAAGWYDDPVDDAFYRWWDGSGWTAQRAPKRIDAR